MWKVLREQTLKKTLTADPWNLDVHICDTNEKTLYVKQETIVIMNNVDNSNNYINLIDGVCLRPRRAARLGKDGKSV